MTVKSRLSRLESATTVDCDCAISEPIPQAHELTQAEWHQRYYRMISCNAHTSSPRGERKDHSQIDSAKAAEAYFGLIGRA